MYDFFDSFLGIIIGIGTFIIGFFFSTNPLVNAFMSTIMLISKSPASYKVYYFLSSVGHIAGVYFFITRNTFLLFCSIVTFIVSLAVIDNKFLKDTTGETMGGLTFIWGILFGIPSYLFIVSLIEKYIIR